MAGAPTLSVLRELTVLISKCASDEIGDQLNVFINALEAVSGATITQKAKLIKSYWRNIGVAPPSHLEFRTFVEKARDVISVTGPKSVHADLIRVVDLLSGTEMLPTEKFLSAFKVDEPQKTLASPPKRAIEWNALRFSDALHSAMQDHENFNRLVSELTAPRKYTMEQINEAARYFFGFDRKFTTKPKAAAAFKARQLDTTIGGAQIKEIEKLRV